jgi:endogenous inhibitor of DNA gyrase (YacG/DUF329 family)
MPKTEIDLSFLKQSTNEIELPSKGIPYDKNSPFSSGKIHIRSWLTPEEKLIDKLDKGNYYNVIKKLVQNVLEEKADVGELTEADLFFTLYWIRGLTYGTSYIVTRECPECGEEVKISIDIGDFPITYLENYKTSIEFELPVTKIQLKMRLPRFNDLIDSTENKHSDAFRMGVKVSPDTYRFAVCTDEMTLPNDAKNVLTKETDFPLMLNKIWPALPANDMLAIRTEIAKFDHGYVDPIDVRCPLCGKYFKQGAPLTEEFFRPSGRESPTIG